jgi:hypothetical protein
VGLEYVNRRGNRYYVLQGKTKSGKPKYFCAKTPGENPVEHLPAEFEIREDPTTAIVTVRRVRPSAILPIERDLLTRLMTELSNEQHAIVDVQGDALIVYTPNIDAGAASRMLGTATNQRENQDRLIVNSQYTAMLRFRLTDREERLYALDRWCFSGSIDDWIFVAGGKQLDALAAEYLPHLGQDTFYEMM